MLDARARRERLQARMSKVIRALVVLLVLAGIGVGAWRYRLAHKAPDVKYKTAPSSSAASSGKVTASGTLSALVTVQVGTQVSGRIQKLYADFNSPVKKGQLVAKIDPQLFEAAVAQAQANYAQAKAAVVNAQAQAKNADKQLARTKALRDAEPRRAAGPRHGGGERRDGARQGRRCEGQPRAGGGPAPPGAGEPLVHEHHLAHRRRRHLAERRRRADRGGVALGADALHDRPGPHEDAGRHERRRGGRRAPAGRA